jgi:hypothetical protein
MRLKKGDVIYLKNGMNVYSEHPFFNHRFDVVIGKIYDYHIEKTIANLQKNIIKSFFNEKIIIEKQKIIEFIKNNIDLEKKQFVISEGEYLVIETNYEKGGGERGFDNFYGGNQIFCKALKNGGYDPNGLQVDFYENGDYTCVISNLEPIRKMTENKKWM